MKINQVTLANIQLRRMRNDLLKHTRFLKGLLVPDADTERVYPLLKNL